MNMYDIIYKKREGTALSPEEIAYFVQKFTKGDIPDYQASALLMAAFIKGLDADETLALTQEMVRSGEILDLSGIEGFKLDKHSTGGVGDKTSLVLAPLLAAANLVVPKLSGRGLGHTGGTIDKLESIPGFDVNLSEERFLEQLQKIGLGILASSDYLAPADKVIYALRDVTATVDHPSLIASSIMSKKIAAGADGILLDVKYGEGAFMKNAQEALELAHILVDIGEKSGKVTRALISRMDTPLGEAVGNGLEVHEAMATLQRRGPADLRELCLALGTQGLLMSGLFSDDRAAWMHLEHLLDSGAAFEKFLAFVQAQGGDVRALPHEKESAVFRASKSGTIEKIHALSVAQASLACGAGRRIKTDSIDPGAGIILLAREGDWIDAGEPLAKIYTQKTDRLADILALLEKSFVIGEKKVAKTPLVHGIVAFRKGESVFTPMKGEENG